MHPGAFKKEQAQTDEYEAKAQGQIAIMELVSAGSKGNAKETLSSMGLGLR